MKIMLSGCLLAEFAMIGCLNPGDVTPGDSSEEASISVSALSSIGGSISQSAILDRAQYWVDQGYVYSPNAPFSYTFSDDAGGKSYRNDCSGLVSEAWHLSTSYITSDFDVDNSLWYTISWDSMQPGDAYVRHDSTQHHIELFAFWDDPHDHSKGFEAYSFNQNNYTVENPYALNNFGKSGHRTYSQPGFHAIHYVNTVAHQNFAPALMYDVLDGTMRIYPWTSNGSSFAGPGSDYYQSGSFDLVNVANRVASGDVDGDGTQDIVTAYQRSDGTFQFNVFKHGDTSAGIWYMSGSFSLSRVAGRLVVDDFNGDGKAEPALVYDNGDGTMKIYRWLSTGSSFTRTTDYQSGSFQLANVGDRVASGDVDGDGKADIVMAYQRSDGTFQFNVFDQGATSAGIWYMSGSFSLSRVAGRLVVDDFNGDGKVEPALVYDNGDGTMKIYRWLSTGSSFTRTTDYQSGSFQLTNVGDRVASGDVDGDGKADIVMAYQRSDGTFQFNVFDQGATSAGIWYISGSYDLDRVGGRMVMGNW